MTGSYTVSSGDTLWSIVKKEYHLSSNAAIAKKVNEIAKANNISSPNTIFTGKSINIGKKSAEKASNDTTSTKTDSANNATKANDSQSSNIFEQWSNNAAKGDKTSDYIFGKDYQKTVKDSGKKDADVYKKDVLAFAEAQIKGYDKNDDKAIDFEEFKAKKLADARKDPANKDLKDEEIIAMAKNAFEAQDLNGDKKIDSEEEASVLAAMDQNEKGEINGGISAEGFKGVSAALGDSAKKAELQNKFNTLHNFLFKKADTEMKVPGAATTNTTSTTQTPDYNTLYNQEYANTMKSLEKTMTITSLMGGFSTLISSLLTLRF